MKMKSAVKESIAVVVGELSLQNRSGTIITVTTQHQMFVIFPTMYQKRLVGNLPDLRTLSH